MAEEPIRKEDIIDLQGTQDSINDLIKALENLSSVMRKDLKEAADELQKSLQGVNVATKEGQERVKNAVAQSEVLAAQQKEQNRLDKEVIGLKARLNSLNSSEAQEVQKLKVAIENKNKAMKEAARLDDSSEGSINKMRSRLKELTAEYNKLSASARKEAAPAIKKLTDELKKAESAIGNNTRNVGNYSSAWKGAGKALLAATGIAGGAVIALRGLFNVIKGGFKTSWDFEYAMSQVKSISGATKEEFDGLRQNAMALGAATKYTASEVASLQTEYAKLGFTAQEIIKVTKATLDLAAATGEDLAKSANIAGSVLRQFQLDASQMQRVVDVMAMSFNKSALDLEKFATAMQHAGPVAATVGESIESTTAKIAVMANAGLDASIAGTSLRNIFIELEKKGLTWDKAMDKIAGSQSKAATALDLFGKRGAVAGIILAENRDLADEFTRSFENASGAAEEMANIMLDNVAGSAKILKSAWEGLVLRTNESNGALKDFLDTLTNLVSAINTKGKPAIDSLFDTRQIDTFADKWKFYAAQGIGFWNTLVNSVVRSKGETQQYSNELSAIMAEERKKQEQIEADKAKAAAAEKARNEERLQQIQAQIDAEEKAAEEAEKIRQAEQKSIKQNYRDRKKWIADEFDVFLKAEEKKASLQDDIKKLLGIKDENKLRGNKELMDKQRRQIEAYNEWQINEKRRLEEQKRQIENDSFNVIYSSITSLSSLYQTQKENELSAAGDNAKKREEIERKYSKRQQTLAIGQALINAAMAITEIWRKYATMPVYAGILTALNAAQMVAQIAIIKQQKFAKGGSGVLQGPSHQRGGINVGIGEAEGGEHIAITSRRMTSKYGPKMLDAVSKSINQGKFFEVWANVNKEMTSDPYTKKMYELMMKTPSIYADSVGNTVKEYPDGRKYIIKKFYRN